MLTRVLSEQSEKRGGNISRKTVKLRMIRSQRLTLALRQQAFLPLSGPASAAHAADARPHVCT